MERKMKTIEELKNLLQEGNIEEAYAGFKEYYKVNNDEISLYYISMIDINYNLDKVILGEMLSNFEKLYKSKNKIIRQGIYDPYLSLLLDVDDMENAYNVSTKARSEGVESYLINYAYAKSSVEYKQIFNNEIEELLLNSIEIAPTDSGKEISEIYLSELYCKKNRFDDAEKIINKAYFTNASDISNYLYLILATYKSPESENKEEYERAIDSKYKYESLMFLSDFYYDKSKFDRVLGYLEELLKLTNNEPFLQKRKVIVLLDLNREDDAFKFLDTMDQEDYDVLMFKAKILLSKNRKKINESKQYLLKALEKRQTEEVYNSLFKACVHTLDLKTFKEVIDSFERISPNHPLLMYGKMKYYNHSNDFDSAYNVSKKLGKMKYNSSYILQLAYCDPKPKKVYKELQKLIKNSDYDFLFVRANYYGDYGLKINRIDYDKFIKDSEQSESNCIDSLATKILLDRGDIDNALKVVTRGVERFNNDLDNCTCIVGYYIYMMMNGIGMEKDVLKAYELAERVIKDNFDEVSESLGNAYAEMAIMLNKDLNPVYDFLVKTIERRYCLGRYFMIVKVGKLLNKDVSYYEKMYKASFKYDTKLEASYYKGNPSTFMMNNF